MLYNKIQSFCSNRPYYAKDQQDREFELIWASQVAQMVKNPPALQETRVSSLRSEAPQKGMAQVSCTVVLDSLRPHGTPGLPVHHQLPESTQTHVHQVGETIQPSHPLSSPSFLAFNLSQHRGLSQMSQFFA